MLNSGFPIKDPNMLHPTLVPVAIRSAEEWKRAIETNRETSARSSLDGAIQIFKGRYFWPLQPDHPGNDIDIETIAHTLAVMPRWGGQTADKDGNPIRYSVAQHSVHVADIAALNRRRLVPKWNWDNSPSPALYGQVHDAPEGYGFADLVRPVKYEVVGYKEKEEALMDRINDVLDVPMNMAIRECVRRVDNMMVFLERDELMGQPVVPYQNEQDHPRITIHDVVPDFYVWSAEEAKQRFLKRYIQIVGSNGNYEPLEYLGRGYRL